MNDMIKRNEEDLAALKEEVSQMWRLVISQVEKSRQALMANDVELAREVVSREKRVDAFELKIDCDCENYIAIYSPVAIDLRLVLSLLKISTTLERIGDFAENIARHVIGQNFVGTPNKLIEELQIEEMFDTISSMLTDSFVSLETENSKVAGKILSEDDKLDQIYEGAAGTIEKHLREDSNIIGQGIALMLLMKKLERIGDHCSNIVEEIVFYLDAKVLKHSDDNKETPC